jgi:hypothetical protein
MIERHYHTPLLRRSYFLHFYFLDIPENPARERKIQMAALLL